MKIDKIITLASESVRLRFLAMERSLRDTGCKLPLWVIPYNNQKFDLPENSFWWEIPEILNWLDSHNCHRAYRKYQCFTVSNYQFVDTDVVFLRNPEKVLEPFDGFITSCGHWRSPNQTFTLESAKMIREKRSSLWEKFIFNTGQFACDRVLYDFQSLKKRCEDPAFRETCLLLKWHEQPGINMLVNASDISITNLTLPPLSMESTFAADYYEVDGVIHELKHENLWKDENKKPYLIHWAGCRMHEGRLIDNLFLKYLNIQEREEWDQWVRDKLKSLKPNPVKSQLSKIKKAIKILIS